LPIYSAADEALWMLGGAYDKMGARFKPQSVKSYQRLVKDYPLSSFVDPAKKRLKDMEAEVPEADPVAVARMKYELENKTKNGMMHDFWAVFKKSPDMTAAAKSGAPAMTSLRPSIPVSVPVPAGATGGVNDLGGTVITGQSDLDKKPDDRMSVQNKAAAGTPEKKEEAAPAAPATPAAAPATGPLAEPAQSNLPSNRQPIKGKKVKTPKPPKSSGK
jgi:outer membrane protein assembly factor BamD